MATAATLERTASPIAPIDVSEAALYSEDRWQEPFRTFYNQVLAGQAGIPADQVKARLLHFLSELGRVSYDRVIISCHGANIRMLYHLSGLALPRIGNGSIHKFLLQRSVTPESTMPDLMAI